MIELQTHARGVILPVRAHAGARQNAVLGVRAGMLRVAVTAAPEKGRANKAIAAVVSEALGMSKSSLELVSGASSARKRFLVVGGDADKLRAAVARLEGQRKSSPD